eukprot:44672-Amphidinium_carterae.1
MHLECIHSKVHFKLKLLMSDTVSNTQGHSRRSCVMSVGLILLQRCPKYSSAQKRSGESGPRA